MKKIYVMMSTFNGERYVGDQIESVLQQLDVEVILSIRDDGSIDGTKEILEKYELDHSNVRVVYGENVGYINSFLLLLKNAEKSDYYAFCDQDDIWKPQKLKRAVSLLEDNKGSIKETTPLLYASALECTDENLVVQKIQAFRNLKLGFYSEFVRHRFAGCTYVFNHDLMAIASECVIEDLVCPHDTLLALLTWSCGGKIIFDNNSYILFRRHGNNASVDGMGLKRRIKKELYFLGDKKNYKYKVAEMLLRDYSHFLMPEYEAFLLFFISYKKRIKNRIKILFDKRLDCGLKRANLIFKLGVLFKSI